MLFLDELKKHCRIDHDDDDDLLRSYLAAAVNYAEQYQNRRYSTKKEIVGMSNSTKQAIRLLASYYYDNRAIDQNISIRTENKTLEAVNNLLYFERNLNV